MKYKICDIVCYEDTFENSIDVIDYTKISSIIQHFLPQKYKSVKNVINDFIFKNSKKIKKNIEL